MKDQTRVLIINAKMRVNVETKRIFTSGRFFGLTRFEKQEMSVRIRL